MGRYFSKFLDHLEDVAVGDFLRSPFAGFEKKDFAFDGAYGVHGYGIFGLHGGLDVFLDLLFEVHIACCFVSGTQIYDSLAEL